MISNFDLDRALFDSKRPSGGSLSISHPLQCLLSAQFLDHVPISGEILDITCKLDSALMTFMEEQEAQEGEQADDENIRLYSKDKGTEYVHEQERQRHEQEYNGGHDPSLRSHDISNKVDQLLRAVYVNDHSSEYDYGIGSGNDNGNCSGGSGIGSANSLQEGMVFAQALALVATATATATTTVTSIAGSDIVKKNALDVAIASNAATNTDTGTGVQFLSGSDVKRIKNSVAVSSTATTTHVGNAHTHASSSGSNTTRNSRGDQKAVKPFTNSKDVYIQDSGATGATAVACANTSRSVPFKPPSRIGEISNIHDRSNPGCGTKRLFNTEATDVGNDDIPLPLELAHLDKILVQKIMSDILISGQAITFEDIAGLSQAKACVQELICWPITRPDLFQGLRALPRGVLLFGPPGTGKTLIGKAIAHEAGATFFSISASSLMSKWIGEGERTVKALFAVACYKQPAVVFLDEVDSLLCQRSSEENEGTRRMKTEFLVQLDGAGTNQDAQVVIVGATNRPAELDEAARRRFVKRIYIPLPDWSGRRQLFQTLLRGASHCLTLPMMSSLRQEQQKEQVQVQGQESTNGNINGNGNGNEKDDLDYLVQSTKGFSGADIRALCTEAAMAPMREMARHAQGDLRNLRNEDVPMISINHFTAAFESVKPTVNDAELYRYIEWNSEFGSFKNVAQTT